MVEPDSSRNPFTTGSAPRTGSDGASGTDWTDQVTDLVVDSVDKVRARTTGPILEVSKGIVYAVVAVLVALPVLLLSVIGTVRLLTLFIPAWIVYLGFGIILTLVGVVLWSKRGRLPT